MAILCVQLWGATLNMVTSAWFRKACEAKMVCFTKCRADEIVCSPLHRGIILGWNFPRNGKHICVDERNASTKPTQSKMPVHSRSKGDFIWMREELTCDGERPVAKCLHAWQTRVFLQTCYHQQWHCLSAQLLGGLFVTTWCKRQWNQSDIWWTKLWPSARVQSPTTSQSSLLRYLLHEGEVVNFVPWIFPMTYGGDWL